MDPSGEGEGSNAGPAAIAEQDFLGWLRRHGAEIDSIDWPSSNTGSGIRGAVAKRDIEGGVRVKKHEAGQLRVYVPAFVSSASSLALEAVYSGWRLYSLAILKHLPQNTQGR